MTCQTSETQTCKRSQSECGEAISTAASAGLHGRKSVSVRLEADFAHSVRNLAASGRFVFRPAPRDVSLPPARNSGACGHSGVLCRRRSRRGERRGSGVSVRCMLASSSELQCLIGWRRGSGRSLAGKQGPLAFHAPAVATRRAVVPDHAVTGDCNGKRVGGTCARDRSSSLR